jgi:hypothetical protein
MSDDVKEETIQVVVRLRPEPDASEPISLTVQDDRSLRLSLPQRENDHSSLPHQEQVKIFPFDKVLGPCAVQSEVVPLCIHRTCMFHNRYFTGNAGL